MQLDQEQLQTHHELYNLIQNETRREILVYIYQEQRNYTQLIEHTGLKPGSLYHHLNVMHDLIIKKDHGLYEITEIGEKIVEDLGLVSDHKPQITNSADLKSSSKTLSTDAQDGSNSSSDISSTSFSPSRDEEINQILWLGTPNYIIIAISLAVIIFLGLQGVALAGIAIYATSLPILFDLFAFLLGLFSLYLIEQLLLSTEIYNRLRFAAVVRIVGMLPAIIVGMALFLLYLGGSNVNPTTFPLIFAITVVAGYLVMVSGLQYLRGMSKQQALNVALVPASIDLLLGVVVLLASL